MTVFELLSQNTIITFLVIALLILMVIIKRRKKVQGSKISDTVMPAPVTVAAAQTSVPPAAVPSINNEIIAVISAAVRKYRGNENAYNNNELIAVISAAVTEYRENQEVTV